jgi:diguanylate cyclase (GGDEF)-like protein
VNTTEKLELLKKADLFSRLNKKELAVIARYCDLVSFQAGQTLFEEGSRVEEMYVIKEGSVLIKKKTEGGEDRDLARFIQGEAFGEMDLLDTAPRSASAVAEGPAVLLAFPGGRLKFSEILEKHPDVFARVLPKLLEVIAGRIRAVDRLISEKTPWIQELKKQLLRDKLTGLHNRAFLDEELQGILGKHPLTSLLVVKPDNFKIINDTYGHEAGDGTLMLIAETLKARLAEGDLGVRYRGDEYCAVLPGREETRAMGLGRDLLLAFKNLDVSRFIKGDKLTLTASVGISTFPAQAPDAKALIARSFRLMLEARNSGGDRMLHEEGG